MDGLLVWLVEHSEEVSAWTLVLLFLAGLATRRLYFWFQIEEPLKKLKRFEDEAEKTLQELRNQNAALLHERRRRYAPPQRRHVSSGRGSGGRDR